MRIDGDRSKRKPWLAPAIDQLFREIENIEWPKPQYNDYQRDVIDSKNLTYKYDTKVKCPYYNGVQNSSDKWKCKNKIQVRRFAGLRTKKCVATFVGVLDDNDIIICDKQFTRTDLIFMCPENKVHKKKGLQEVVWCKHHFNEAASGQQKDS